MSKLDEAINAIEQANPALKTPNSYRFYLKKQATKDFLVRIINMARNERHYYLDRNINIFLLELDSIENADFEESTDENPF